MIQIFKIQIFCPENSKFRSKFELAQNLNFLNKNSVNRRKIYSADRSQNSYLICDIFRDPTLTVDISRTLRILEKPKYGEKSCAHR